MSVSVQKKISNINKINMSLLKNLAQPLEESLNSLIESIQDLQEDKIQIANFNGLTPAHLITKSLEMIDARSELKVAESIELLTKKIQTHNIKDQQELYISTNLIKNAATALLMHIKSVINSNKPHSSIALWSVLSPMQRQLGFKNVSIENMYYPKPKFNNKEFQPLKKEVVKKVSKDALEEFEETVKTWLNSDDELTVKKSLKNIAKISRGLYDLKHRPGYQSYWLAIMGRLQLALLDPNLEINNKENLATIFENMSVELLRFGEDALKVSNDSLITVITPLVREDILEMAKYSTILKEIVERFNIDIFYEEAKKAMDSEKIKHKNEFLANKKELIDIVYDLKKEWEKLLTTSIAQNKKNLNKVINLLNGKKYLLPSVSAANLMFTIAKLKEVYTEDFSEKITQEIGDEVATGLIMLENIIEKNGEISPGLEQQIDLQIKRINLAYSEEIKALKELPEATWDEDTKNDEYIQSMIKVSAEIRKDIYSIESALSEVFSNKPSPISGKEIDYHFKMIVGALRITDEELAAKIVISIRNLVVGYYTNTKKSPEVEEQIIMGLSSLTMFLDAKEKGDPNPVMKLAVIAETLLGEKVIDHTENDENFNMNTTFDFIDEKQVLESTNEKEKAEEIIEEESNNEDVTKDLLEEINKKVAEHNEEQPLEEQKFPTYSEDALLSALEEYPDPTPVEDSESGMKVEDVSIEEVSLSVEEETHNEINNVEVESSPLPYFMTEEDLQIVNVIDSSDDTDLAEVFIEELDLIIVNIETVIKKLNNEPNDLDSIRDLKRQYHTLKGSGRMSQYTAIGEVGWRIEHYINTLIDDDKFEWDNLLKGLINTTLKYLKVWKEELEQEGHKTLVDATEILEALYLESHKHDNIVENTEEETIIEHEHEHEHEVLLNEEVSSEPETQDDFVDLIKEAESASVKNVEEDSIYKQHEEEITEASNEEDESIYRNIDEDQNQNIIKIGEDISFKKEDFDTIVTMVNKDISIIEEFDNKNKEKDDVVISGEYIKSIHDLHVLTQTISFDSLTYLLSIMENKLFENDRVKRENKKILSDANNIIVNMLHSYLIDKEIPERNIDIENNLQSLLTNEEDYNTVNEITNEVKVIPEETIEKSEIISDSEESETDKYWEEALEALTIMSEQMARFQEIMIKLSGKK
ncbi:TPA: Hpt domain-containing protein [Escherichia coli]|nr:Hpt domain-containing protein [Escherichia coli]